MAVYYILFSLITNPTYFFHLVTFIFFQQAMFLWKRQSDKHALNTFNCCVFYDLQSVLQKYMSTLIHWKPMPCHKLKANIWLFFNQLGCDLTTLMVFVSYRSWIDQGGWEAWQPNSLYLTTLKFYVWAYVKKNNLKNNENIKTLTLHKATFWATNESVNSWLKYEKKSSFT